jgi:hypothetical protein
MIHAYAGPLLILGLTRPQFETLLIGRSVHVLLRSLPWWQRLFTPRLREIVIIFGEDRPAVLRQLARTGLAIPPDVFALAEETP